MATNKTVLFSPSPAGHDYTYVTQSTAALPTNPSDGAPLLLGNDDSIEVNLTEGHEALFCGERYTHFYVGSNGYVTFDGPDTDPTASRWHHYNGTRISVLFNDLDPSSHGIVVWQKLGDRAVVTWLNVAQAVTVNQSTFQVEIYYDGRIRLAWLAIDGSDAIVGLSDGSLPDRFIESDFSTSHPWASKSFGWNQDGIVSIPGDVSALVNCVYFGVYPEGLDPVAAGDRDGDGVLSIVGDVPCFVGCVYLGNCPE